MEFGIYVYHWKVQQAPTALALSIAFCNVSLALLRLSFFGPSSFKKTVFNSLDLDRICIGKIFGRTIGIRDIFGIYFRVDRKWNSGVANI